MLSMAEHRTHTLRADLERKNAEAGRGLVHQDLQVQKMPVLTRKILQKNLQKNGRWDAVVAGGSIR